MTSMHSVVEPLTERKPTRDNSIGAILIDSGRLTPADADRVVELQRENDLRFGDAARELNLVSEADIQFALARQFDYPFLQRGEDRVSESVVAAYDPFTPQVEALRALRSLLMLRWFNGERRRKAIAVVSPGQGEGRSWFAANLAVVFSQLGQRTLLIDADLRNPSQHALFALGNRRGLSTLLAGHGGVEAVQRIPALVDLSVLPAGTVPPNPQELLCRPVLLQLLQHFSAVFDVILIDTPPGGRYADGQMLAARSSGALMIAHKNRSRLAGLRDYAERLRQGRATIIGSVLNEGP